MKDTIRALLESEGVSNVSEATVFSSLRTINESQRNLLGFTPRKVIIQRDTRTDQLFTEYANNVERLMKDQECCFESAITMICNEYGIEENELNIVVTLEDVINMSNFKEFASEYNFYAK